MYYLLFKRPYVRVPCDRMDLLCESLAIILFSVVHVSSIQLALFSWRILNARVALHFVISSATYTVVWVSSRFSHGLSLRFFLFSITRGLVLRLANLTIIARGGGLESCSPSLDCPSANGGLPSPWTTSRSSMTGFGHRFATKIVKLLHM